ncbi:MAG: PAS domain S-box protein [Chloroflexi bacterium]|nr:PAS domain S-box protein [Chloroflexota bacterium]
MEDQQKTKSQLIDELNKVRQRVSALEESENNLHKSETRYRQIFETNLAIKIIIDPVDGKIVEANQSACQFYGYSLETLISMSITDINMLSDQEVKKKMEKAKKEERHFSNIRHQLASGEIRDVEVYSGPVVIGDSTLLYSIVQDVTERKHAQEALEKSETLLRKIADNYPNSFLSIIEKDFSIGYTAGQEFKKQNLDPKQFIGLSIEDVFGTQTNFVREHYKKTFAGEERSFELHINDQDQYYRAVPLYAEDGTVPRILAVVENITERKKAEQELNMYRDHLEELVEKRTAELKKKMDEQMTTFDLMIGREVRMSELKEAIKKLRAQLERAGITPEANDPLLGE